MSGGHQWWSAASGVGFQCGRGVGGCGEGGGVECQISLQLCLPSQASEHIDVALG